MRVVLIVAGVGAAFLCGTLVLAVAVTTSSAVSQQLTASACIGSSVPRGGETVLATMYGGPGDDTRTREGHGAFGSLTAHAAFAELSTNPESPNPAAWDYRALGGLAPHSLLRITYHGRSVIAEKLDVGRGGPAHPRIDLWWQTAALLGFNGMGDVRISAAPPGARPTPVPGASSTDDLADAQATCTGFVSDGSAGSRAVAAALRWVGTPYSWGGGDANGPTFGTCGPAGCQGSRVRGFDCSGLTLYAWAQAGVALSHFTGDQWNEGLHLALAIGYVTQLRPGDLVFFNMDGPLGHVGLYVGGGRMVEAPHTGDVVKVVDFTTGAYGAAYAGAVRPMPRSSPIASAGASG
jgi:cell wall-associated NlpC family hydrolase